MHKLTELNQKLPQDRYRLVEEQGVIKLASIEEGFSPLYIDFLEGKSRHRRLYGGGKNQPLAKAVGLHKFSQLRVVDLTAGLGRDAFVLSTLGCKLEMVERNPVIALLLENALERVKLSDDNEVKNIVSRMTLHSMDAMDYLQGLGDKLQPEVIYLDPMYPHRQKSALVKKEMRIFRDLVGEAPDNDQLLEQAKHKASKRVVVKRPKGGEFLSGQKPDFQINAPNTRYDIYL